MSTPPLHQTTSRDRRGGHGTPTSGSGSSDTSMFVALVPWLLFSVLTHRLGAGAAGYAALVAAVLSAWLAARPQSRRTGIKIVDVSGITTFTVLAVVAFVAGPSAQAWIADFGRAAAAYVLAVVMLVSAATVPFTEQYARATVPRELWASPEFRAVNRKVSAAWGLAILVMATGHAVAGVVDPTTAPDPGGRPVELVLNWLLPLALVWAAIRYTAAVSARAGKK